MLAKTQLDLGDYDEAEIAYRQALAVAPDDINVQLQSAEFYEKIGKLDQALIHYENAYDLDNYYPNLLMKISRLRVKLQKSHP